ncbi:MAG: EAL domain-containing protein [Nitrospiria bacterium]
MGDRRKNKTQQDSRNGTEVLHGELDVLKHALDHSVMVTISDEEGILRYVNKKFCEISKYRREELIGQDSPLVNSHSHSKDFMAQMWKTVHSGNPWKGELRNRSKDGGLYWVDTTITPFLNGKDKAYNFLTIQTDITKQKKSEEHAHHLAYYDTLTGLPNRTLFLDRLAQGLAQAKRHHQTMAILFLDLDRFKLTNESLGHHVGDRLLEIVAHRLGKCLRKDDFLARMGGDEFGLLLPVISKDEDVILISDRILKALKQPFQIENQDMRINGSIGISIYPSDGESTETLLRNADMAMSHAKEQGKGQFNFYSPRLTSKLNQNLKIESALNNAIAQHEFKLNYQPKICLRTGKVIGMEALVRWERPGIGLVSPADFIPVSEETGLIIQIGEWVLRTACEQNKAWQLKGLPKISMAVNVSAIQFKQGDFVEMVARVLKDICLDPKDLILEMTESLLMENTDVTIERFKNLKAAGVTLSVDDFGTGYSSLGYLKRFPINSLKIDRSFVNDIAHDEDDAVITTAIISLAHNLRMDVVAEGIETEEQLIFLQENGCDSGQGFLFSRPVSGDAAEVLLQKRNWAPALDRQT